MLAIHRRFYREFVEIQQTLSNLTLGIEVCGIDAHLWVTWWTLTPFFHTHHLSPLLSAAHALRQFRPERPFL